MSEVRITVPLTPPSVNTYVRHTRAGRHYVTAEAKAFWAALAICARGQQIREKAYAVTLSVFLGHAQRLDADNACKVTLDSLVKAGIIDSDAKITDLCVSKRRDRENPRTEIVIRAALEES